MSYVRIVHEAKDLRSALLLEQAAYCYLMCTPVMVRKYAFHIILSGYRFSKSGQKKHSSRSYRQGFQVKTTRISLFDFLCRRLPLLFSVMQLKCCGLKRKCAHRRFNTNAELCQICPFPDLR